MRALLDHASWLRFMTETRRHGFRFTCGDCLHELRDGSCAHEWPNDEHRLEPDLGYAETGEPSCEVVFCKEFEVR